MPSSETLRSGRTPFEIRGEDRDYSGLSISGRYLADQNIERSYFNGVNLSDCGFARVQLNNTEFSEAKVAKSTFEDVNFAGSDFVDCLFEEIAFTRSTFEKGEWREATFVNCRFVECDFLQTTVTLCKFVNCAFDTATIASAEHRSVYYNVFTGCRFERLVHDVVFASRNFGSPSDAGAQSLVPSAAGPTIENVCLLNNREQLQVADLADVAEVLCSSLAGGQQRRNSTLTFFAKIVRTISDERRISATSLVYLEELITRFAGVVEDRDLLMAAMSAVIEIRTALFNIVAETQQAEPPPENLHSLNIRFAPTYGREQVEVLRRALSESAGLGPDDLKIKKLESGSTIVEMMSDAAMTTAALLIALNFILRQATVTVTLVGKLRRTVRDTFGSRKPPAPRKVARPALPKVRAILRTGAVSPELAPIRSAVHRSGRVLVDMDVRAAIVVTAQEGK